MQQCDRCHHYLGRERELYGSYYATLCQDCVNALITFTQTQPFWKQELTLIARWGSFEAGKADPDDTALAITMDRELNFIEARTAIEAWIKAGKNKG